MVFLASSIGSAIYPLIGSFTDKTPSLESDERPRGSLLTYHPMGRTKYYESLPNDPGWLRVPILSRVPCFELISQYAGRGEAWHGALYLHTNLKA